MKHELSTKASQANLMSTVQVFIPYHATIQKVQKQTETYRVKEVRA